MNSRETLASEAEETARRPDEVAVIGCGAFVSGYAGLAGFASGTPDADRDSPAATMIPARQRRRASTLSKAFADAYAEAIESADLEPQSVASVFGAALGEASTMIRLLDQMWSEDESLSPMLFATSVHNAASGAISIATENRGITTAIGSDYDTPAMALLEGIGIALSGNVPVIVCCGDEAPPAGLITEDIGWQLMTAAIAICPVSNAPASSPRLSGIEIRSAYASGSPLPPIPSLAPKPGNGSAFDPTRLTPLARNPNVGLLDLALAIRAGHEGIVALDRGAGRGFCVGLHAGSE